MANRVACLTKRVKIAGQWFVRKPIIKTSGFVTEKVEHNGQPVHAPGTFVLEWYENGKRQRKPLTESALEAQDALRKKTQTLEARSNGLTVVEDQGAKGKGVREKVDATFAEITVQPMRQSEVAMIQ